MVIHDSLSIAPNDRRINTVGVTVSHYEKKRDVFKVRLEYKKKKRGERKHIESQENNNKETLKNTYTDYLFKKRFQVLYSPVYVNHFW